MKKVWEIKNRIEFLEKAIAIREDNEPMVLAMKLEIATLNWVLNEKQGEVKMATDDDMWAEKDCYGCCYLKKSKCWYKNSPEDIPEDMCIETKLQGDY